MLAPPSIRVILKKKFQAPQGKFFFFESCLQAKNPVMKSTFLQAMRTTHAKSMVTTMTSSLHLSQKGIRYPPQNNFLGIRYVPSNTVLSYSYPSLIPGGYVIPTPPLMLLEK
ncbi:Hypothetical protein, putative [Bodo saltans]|uniref:Uncharacterized protein n=1 Tax=Bodo saltans TaxID=75058 RepID=A0A0S4IJX6_BODSA|nr:Hypothetical protein, putative [Bodo saltans]|eukprot:CUE57621.1 Hypothetical protein, putative [Bodo saltans]